MGRPKGLHPPTVTAVRITAETKKKLDSEHKKWNSKEPYDRTLYRALSELEQIRKKVKAQELEIDGLQTSMRTKDLAFDRLFNVHYLTKNTLQKLGINIATIEVPNK